MPAALEPFASTRRDRIFVSARTERFRNRMPTPNASRCCGAPSMTTVPAIPSVIRPEIVPALNPTSDPTADVIHFFFKFNSFPVF